MRAKSDSSGGGRPPHSPSVERRDHFFESLRQGGCKDVEFVIGRQADFEAAGVEHEGGVGKDGIFLAVDGVAEDGAAEVSHVDAQLVGAACAWIEGDEGVALGLGEVIRR